MNQENKEQNITDIQIEPKKKVVSHSQYSMWLTCPRKYYLNYIAGKKIVDLSFNMFFGTAMHHAIQLYIKTLYTVNRTEASKIDLYKEFSDKFKSEVEKESEKFKYKQEEYDQFLTDGLTIIEAFLKSDIQKKYFPDDKYEFIGVEIPLDISILNNINFIAYIDLVLKDKKTNKIKIFDFKTSNTGWNVYIKEDMGKFSQLLLYKTFYSNKYNISMSDIDVEFFIVKRNLYENVSFPQSRIQTFQPEDHNSAIGEVVDSFTKFVTESFDSSGKHFKEEDKFQKIAGKAYKNCKKCTQYKVNCFPTKEDQNIKS